MLLHLHRLPDADEVGEVLRADGHALTQTHGDADLVVTGGSAEPLSAAHGTTILQVGGALRLPTGVHLPTPVLDAQFRATPAAEALGLDLMAAATLLIDTPRTAIVGARADVVPLVSNANGQHLALLYPHSRRGWHWWVHEDTLDALPWIDAAIEHHSATQRERVSVGA